VALTRATVGLPGRAFARDVDDALASRSSAVVVSRLKSQFGKLEQLSLVSPFARGGEGTLDSDGVRHVAGTVRVDNAAREPVVSSGAAARLQTLVSDDVEDGRRYASAVVQLAVCELDAGNAVTIWVRVDRAV